MLLGLSNKIQITSAKNCRKWTGIWNIVCLCDIKYYECFFPFYFQSILQSLYIRGNNHKKFIFVKVAQLLLTWIYWDIDNPQPGEWQSPWFVWDTASTAWSCCPRRGSCCPGWLETAEDMRDHSWLPEGCLTMEDGQRLGWTWKSSL